MGILISLGFTLDKRIHSFLAIGIFSISTITKPYRIYSLKRGCETFGLKRDVHGVETRVLGFGSGLALCCEVNSRSPGVGLVFHHHFQP